MVEVFSSAFLVGVQGVGGPTILEGVVFREIGEIGILHLKWLLGVCRRSGYAREVVYSSLSYVHGDVQVATQHLSFWCGLENCPLQKAGYRQSRDTGNFS